MACARNGSTPQGGVAPDRQAERRGCRGPNPAPRVPRAAIAAGAVLLFGAMAATGHAGLFDKVLGTSPAGTAKAAGVVQTADEVKIPLKALDAGKAIFLVLPQEGRELHYFALRRSDGQYRAALDACDVCFRTNRGYRQEGDLMVCNNCSQTFPSAKVGDVKGGCNPHPLPSRVEGAFLVIAKRDIAAGREYFVRKRT